MPVSFEEGAPSVIVDHAARFLQADFRKERYARFAPFVH